MFELSDFDDAPVLFIEEEGVVRGETEGVVRGETLEAEFDEERGDGDGDGDGDGAAELEGVLQISQVRVLALFSYVHAEQDQMSSSPTLSPLLLFATPTAVVAIAAAEAAEVTIFSLIWIASIGLLEPQMSHFKA